MQLVKVLMFLLAVMTCFFLMFTGASLVLDVIPDPSEDLLVGQTLKRPFFPNRILEEQKDTIKEETNYDPTFVSNNAGYQEFRLNDAENQSILPILHLSDNATMTSEVIILLHISLYILLNM